MTDTSDAIVINPNITPAQVKTVVRYAVTLLGPFLPKLFSGFFTPEVQAIIQSDEFATLISASSGAIVAVAMTAWGVFDTWRHKTLLVAAATAAPNDKFVVAKPGEAK